MKILHITIVILVLFCGTKTFAQEGSVEERFEDIFKELDKDWKKPAARTISIASNILDFWQSKKLMAMGPEIVPYLVEKVRSYQDREWNLLRKALAIMATALILDKDIYSGSEDEWKEITKTIYDRDERRYDVNMWLKWWEEDGKSLYEKRMKELGEKEKTPEKPETQEPNELPEEEPPLLKSKPQPEPEKAQPPAEPSKAKPDVQRPPSEKLPESSKKVPADDPESQPQSANWLLLGLAAVAIFLAGVVIVIFCRKHKTT